MYNYGRGGNTRNGEKITPTKLLKLGERLSTSLKFEYPLDQHTTFNP